MKFKEFSSGMGSEGREFKVEDFYNRDNSDEVESGSMLHMLENVRDEHVSEAPDRSADKGVDQAPDNLSGLVGDFRAALQNADLTDQDQINDLNEMIDKVAALNPSQAETLKEEFVEKKIE